MTPKTDPELLRAWRAERDEDAFRLLVVRHGALVQGVARRRLDEPDLAPDVAGRAFTLLAGQPERVPADRLAQVAVHLSETENRAGRRRAAHERRAASEAFSTQTPMSPHAQDLAHRIDASLRRLKPEDRECVLLHVGEGLPYEEVASLLGLGEDAARMRTSRALDRLRRMLGAAAFAPAMEGLRPVPLSTSGTDRLVRVALAPSAGGAAVSAALRWLLMTKTQKIGLGLSALLVLLVGGGAAHQALAVVVPPAPIARPDVRGFVGRWRGTLTYVVRRTGRRVSQNVASAVDATPNGLRFRIRYDTPGWGVDARWSFSPDGRTLVKLDKGRRETFRLTAATPDRVVGERHVDEPGRPYDQRLTLARTDRGLSLLTEERLPGRDWAFASEYRMGPAR